MREKQSEIQEKYIEQTLSFFKENNNGYLDLAMRFGKCRTTIEVLKRMYNNDCTFVWAYCRYFWESHVNLPHIDINELEEFVRTNK